MDSDIPEDIEPEIWNEVKTYFTDKKWRKTTEYLKRRNCRLLENYKLLLSLGFATAPKPFYMLERKKRANDPSSSDDSSKSDAEEDTTSNVKDIVKKRGRPRCRTIKGPAVKVRDRGVSRKIRKTVETKTKELTESNTKVSVKGSSELLHLVVPKHLEGIVEPMYMINLDDHPSDAENDDYEFQGFTDRNFELSVIRFNFFRHMKSKIENEILSGNSNEGDDTIQESAVEENEIVRQNLGESNDDAQDNNNGDKDQAEVKKSEVDSTKDENKSRYLKRNIPKINNMKERVPDDGEYICRGFQCIHCKTSFSSPIYRDRHESRYCKKTKHVEDTNRRYKCDECGKRFRFKIALKKHKLIHSGVRPYSCNVCKKRFTRKGNLDRHISSIHNKERRYKCDVCNKRFTQKSDLERHKLIHSGVRPHECNVCNKRFTRKGNLDTHISSIHNKERRYKCDVCNKRFTQKSDLERQKLIHCGVRPHECNVCNKRFTRKGNLDTHISSIHNKERRYKCDVCNKRFTQKSDLERHILIHCGVRPHECNVCNKRFTRKGNLDTHISTVHNRERRYICKPHHCKVCNKKFTNVG